MLGRDGIAGLVCLALSIGMFALTFGLPPAAMVPVGPAFYPRIVILLFGLLSVMLIVFDLRAARGGRPGTAVAAGAGAGAQPNYRLVLATFIEFGLYIVILPLIGFRISTFLFVLALEVTLEWPRDTKRWVLMVAVAIATSAACYFVFEDYLSVLLPRGTWSGL
ncbi:MAG: tripartite tricarboxylate transporter TctB family protein [Nitrobacter sp.]